MFCLEGVSESSDLDQKCFGLTLSLSARRCDSTPPLIGPEKQAPVDFRLITNIRPGRPSRNRVAFDPISHRISLPACFDDGSELCLEASFCFFAKFLEH